MGISKKISELEIDNNPSGSDRVATQKGEENRGVEFSKFPISETVSEAIDVISESIDVHERDTENPHRVTKSQVGLDNVPNLDATVRANHTGTQPASTVSDFAEAVDGRVAALLMAHSPGASLADISARRPGIVNSVALANSYNDTYSRWSARDSVQFSDLTGGNSGTAIILGGRVGQVNDVASGATHYANGSKVGASIPTGPTLKERDGRRYWEVRAGESFTMGGLSLAGDCTLSILCRPRRYDFDGLFGFYPGDNDQPIAHGGRIVWGNRKPEIPILAGLPGADVAIIIRIRSMNPARRLEIFMDGKKVADATDPSTDAFAANLLTVGSAYQAHNYGFYGWFEGDIYEVCLHNSALSDLQVSWLSQSLLSRGTPPDVEAAPGGVNLLVVGNSLSDSTIGPSAGNYAGFAPPYAPTQMWPSQLAALHPSWTVTNLGRASRSTAPIGGDDNEGNVISPTFAADLAAYGPDVVVIWEYINHLVYLIQAGVPNPGTVAAQAVLALGAAAVTAGKKVVVGTGTNRADLGGATYQSEYLVGNDYLRTNGAGTAYHALADIGGDPRFQDPSSGNYFNQNDQVHLTLLGQSIAATEFFGPAIVAAIA